MTCLWSHQRPEMWNFPQQKLLAVGSISVRSLFHGAAAGCGQLAETLFALSLATLRHAAPASVSLNVTSHLWLHPVLFIAEQLKCEGSQWEDKYKRQQAEGLSQTKAPIFTTSSLSSPPETSTVRKRSDTLVQCTDWLTDVHDFPPSFLIFKYFCSSSTSYVKNSLLFCAEAAATNWVTCCLK